jgi:hypothetical protein
MVALQGLLEAEAGHIVLAALEPLARPHSAEDERSGDQRRADALCELARRNLESGQLPKVGGVRPQLTVVVDLDSLLGRPGAMGGELGWAEPLAPEACRRLACDGASPASTTPHTWQTNPAMREAWRPGSRRPWPLLPPILGAPPASRWMWDGPAGSSPPPNAAPLAVRDGGCVFPDCARPLAWCEGHHLVPWQKGGPTDLANLAPLCRQHHRTVHEGGWQLTRGPDGRFTATPPHRPRRHPPPHRRHPTAA